MTTPKSLHAQNLKGAQYLLAHNYQKAANAFDGVLKADPDNIGANAGIAALSYDDPLLLQLCEYFANLPFEITLFPPLTWQSERICYRDMIGA